MKAIVTKYHGATATRGARISATAEGQPGNPWRVSISRDHETSLDAAHKAAALALCKKMKWVGELAGGEMPDGRQAWVFIHHITHPLLAALQAARGALNTVPNTRLNGGFKDSYAVASAVDSALAGFKEVTK